MRNYGLLSLLLAIFLAGSSPASAAFTGSIEGQVFDTTGGVLPGVTVELKGLTGGGTRVFVTGPDGRYTIDGLQPDTYQLAFKLINFATSLKTAQVDGGQNVNVDARLPLSAGSEIVVTGKRTFTNLEDLTEPINGLIGIADAATVGVITAQQIEHRPTERAAELLESVPGVIISQHSGEGKANQYYLRGFNLDHGTDIAITVAGVPVNMPTHAHGQGYADTNFLIPELVSAVQYKKGPYYADQGDFTTSGGMNVNYANTLDKPIAFVGAGDLGYGRALYAASPQLGPGHLLYALEVFHNDGPWTHPDNYRKLNGVIRYTVGNERTGFSLTGMGYTGKWSSTDQVAQRAIDEGVIGRFGAIDPTDGGRSHRYTASADWQTTREKSLTKVQAYAIDYSLDLTSNFTYFLENPERGDQFTQKDRRFVTGFKANHQWLMTLGGFNVENEAGVQERNDNIGEVGIFKTQARKIYRNVRVDRVVQRSLAGYAQTTINWSSKLRTILGAREDNFVFHVRSDNPANSGKAKASLLSPKLSVIAGPWNQTEVYANFGYGFHSNDGRGSTITQDPDTGEPADRVTPLVRAKGGEIGVRSTIIPGLQTTFALWGLDLASELIFSGDAGSTSAGRPSRRRGIEFSNYYNLPGRFIVDADYVYSRARFADFDPVGAYIPGSPEQVLSGGISFVPAGPFFASLRFRYFGPRPLIEDNTVRSEKSNTFSARLGYEFPRGVRLDVDLFNLFNKKVSDIDYYYQSRLQGEPAGGVNDIHTHPIEPRSFRIGLTKAF